MRKKLKIILFSLVVFGSCQKERDIDRSDPGINTHPDSLTISDVRSWITAQHGNSKLRSAAATGKFDLANVQLTWDRISSGRSNTDGNYLFADFAGSPTFQQVKQGFRKMLFTKGKGGINAYILEVVPDVLAYQRSGTIDPGTFTGRVFIYADNYQFIGGFIYIDGKRAGTIKPEGSKTTSGEGKNLKVASAPAGGGGSSSCEWVQSNYINSSGEVVIYAEKVCTIDPIDLSQDGPPGLPPIDQNPPEYAGGGGSGGGGAPAVSNLPGENNAKINPKEYMQCFSNLPDIGSKMTITVYVQEPAPGLPFNYGTNSVGHTAIGLTKTYKGQSITQVVGFYPDATGKAKMHAPSKVLDNSGLEYNVSISYSVIASDFNHVANFIANPPNTYDLMDYNCTNFAYSACMAGGIKLPDPVGNMGLGQTGMTPAALGNTIRDAGNVANSNLKGGSVDKTNGPCNK